MDISQQESFLKKLQLESIHELPTKKTTITPRFSGCGSSTISDEANNNLLEKGKISAFTASKMKASETGVELCSRIGYIMDIFKHKHQKLHLK